MEFLGFMFSGFWTFLGCIILIGAVFRGIGIILFGLAAIVRAFRRSKIVPDNLVISSNESTK